MASSTLSLDSLSSPSPSPSPPPNKDRQRNTKPTATPPTTSLAPFRALDDTDSELSELTDDDQDPSASADKRAPSATITHSSSKGPCPDDDDDANPPTHTSPRPGSSASRSANRGKHQRSLSARRGGPGRKKRSSIVPAPMWGWAETKASASNPAVEEEEEEATGPPRAMEEEEEEDEEDDDEEEFDDDGSGAQEDEPRDFSHQRRSGPYVAPRFPGASPVLSPGKVRENGVKRRPRKRGGEDDPQVGDSKPEKRSRQPASAKRMTQQPNALDEDDPRGVNGDDDDDDGSAYGSPYPSNRKRKPIKPRGLASSSKKRKSSGEDESTGPDQPPSKKKRNGAAKTQQPQDDHAGSDDPETESEDEPIKVQPPAFPSPKPNPPSPTSSTSSANSNEIRLRALAALAFTDSLAREAASASLIPPANDLPATSTAASSNGAASRSRSQSLDPKSDAEEASEEEPPARPVVKTRGGRGRGGRGGRGRYRGRGAAAAAARDRRDANINGTTAVEVKPNIVHPPAKKGPPPPLDLKIDTNVAQVAVIETGDMSVDGADDEVNDRSMEDAETAADPEDPEEAEEEEEEEEEEEDVDEHSGGEEEEQEADGEEEALEGEDDAADNEGDEDQDQENDGEAAEAEHEGEEEEEPSPDGDADDHEESDLQPAHRAEALDVLAMIELKFALLRERVYLEKMEALAWEEKMVQASTHPELQHLQKELSRRRDKRLELASRKRTFEVASATTRRKADESGVWSWWKHATDELQTEMIAETSRKRRRLERDRRAVERPQPARMIPLPSPIDIHNAILPPPSIRKIIKSYPFGSRKQNKSDTYHLHHSHYPKHLVYPEISTLSSAEISSDLEYLCQYQKRPPSAYDMQHQPPSHSQSQPYSQTGRNGPSLPGMGRSLSMGINGNLGPSQTPLSSMGPPSLHGHQQHGMGYDQYGDLPPSSYGPGPTHPVNVGRMRDSSSSSYTAQGPGGAALPLGPPPPRPSSSATLRENIPYSSFPGHGGRSQASSQHGPYPGDHEMSGVGPSGGGGGGHQLMPHHPFFSSQASASAGGNVHGPSPSSSAVHHTMKGGPMNGRRSISPVPVLPNGASGAKPNGSWMGLGMGMSGFHLERAPSASGKGEWDARAMHEEDERERLMMREREQRKRDEREREKDRERDREFERERNRRERDDLDRERQREHHHILQMAQQHRQPPPPGSSGASSHPGLSHLHSSQGSGMASHHHGQHHHHRAPHHHHVVHHHHRQHSSSSVPPPAGANSIMHSPRSTREYESSRPPPGSFHSGPSHTEVITLSSGSKPPPSSLPPREREGHWPTKGSEEGHHHSPMIDYRDRDRERDAMNRDRNERDARKLHSHRHSSGPPMIPLEDRGDRPMATPFTMASSQTMQHTASGISSTHINGSSSTSSPRGPPSWNTPGNPMDDPSYRMSSSGAPPPPPGYMGPSHDRSPVQAHRYPASSSSHPSHPMGRISNNNNSSSAYHRMSSPPLPPPSRARPPQSPSYPTSMSNSHRSPVTSPKTRPLSPVTSKHLLSGPPPGPAYSPSPRLSGPGRTSTPTGHVHHPTSSSSGLGLGQQPPSTDSALPNGIGSSSSTSYHNNPVSGRTTSPLMSSLHPPPPPGSRSTISVNGIGIGGGSGAGGGGHNIVMGGPDRDRMDRERHSSPRLGPSASSSSVSNVPPPPPPSKLGTAQMVDGH